VLFEFKCSLNIIITTLLTNLELKPALKFKNLVNAQIRGEKQVHIHTSVNKQRKQICKTPSILFEAILLEQLQNQTNTNTPKRKERQEARTPNPTQNHKNLTAPLRGLLR
jgi:hypothetical protein